MWSKAQKAAAIELQEYGSTRDEKDYQGFLDSLAVPLGDRLARLEMEKPVLLQKPFTVKKVLQAMQQLNVSARS